MLSNKQMTKDAKNQRRLAERQSDQLNEANSSEKQVKDEADHEVAAENHGVIHSEAELTLLFPRSRPQIDQKGPSVAPNRQEPIDKDKVKVAVMRIVSEATIFPDVATSTFRTQEIRNFFAGAKFPSSVLCVPRSEGNGEECTQDRDDGFHSDSIIYQCLFIDTTTNDVLTPENIDNYLYLNIGKHENSLKLSVSLAPKRIRDETIEETMPSSMWRTPADLDPIGTHTFSKPASDLYGSNQRVDAYINWQSIQKARYCSLTAKDLKESSAGFGAPWELVPGRVMEFVNQANRTRNMTPCLFHIEFDPKAIRGEKLDIGTPQFAIDWVRAIKHGEIKVLLRSRDYTLTQLNLLFDIMTYNKSNRHPTTLQYLNNPHRVWYKHQNRINIAEDELLCKYDHQQRGYFYEPKFSFFDFEEYAIVTAVSMCHEKQALTSAIATFSSVKRPLRLITTTDYEGREMIGMLEPPEEVKELRLTPGTSLKICFEETIPDCGEGWHAIVLPSVPFVPNEYVPLLVKGKFETRTTETGTEIVTSRRRYKEKLNIIHAKSLSPSHMITEIRGAIPNMARVQVQEFDTVFSQNMKALERINSKLDNVEENTPWQEQNKNVLIGKALNTLQDKDGWRCIRVQHPKFWETKLTLVNKEQQNAYMQITKAPGKTHFHRIVAALLFELDEKCQIVIISSANEAVNTLTLQLNTIMEKGQKAGKIPKNRYVVRHHSRATEKKIEKYAIDFSHDKGRQAPQSYLVPDNTESGELGDVALADEVLTSDRILKSVIDNANARAFEGIDDPRVKIMTSALGYIMIKVSGVVYDENLTEEGKWKDFRDMYNNAIVMSNPTLTFKQQFGEKSRELYRYVLRNASAVLGTTTGLATDTSLEAISKSANILVHEEAMREQESNLLPYFAAPFEKLDLFLMVGDFAQIGPRSQSNNVKTAPFCKQANISFVSRLAHLRLHVNELVQQNRMVPEICAIVNKIAYHEKLHDAPSTNVSLRLNAQTARCWVERMCESAGGARHPSNTLQINFMGKGSRTSTGRNNSKYNNAFLCWISDELPRLMRLFHANATFAIITPYTEERNRLLTMKTNFGLKRMIPQARLNRLHVGTIDSVQGNEYDVVIFLVTIDEHFGHTGDLRRMAVALSRAKNLMIVLLNREQIDAASGSGDSIKDLALFSSQPCILVTHESFPSSAAYTPEIEHSKGG